MGGIVSVILLYRVHYVLDAVVCASRGPDGAADGHGAADPDTLGAAALVWAVLKLDTFIMRKRGSSFLPSAWTVRACSAPWPLAENQTTVIALGNGFCSSRDLR